MSLETERPRHSETPCWTSLEVILTQTGRGLWRWEVRGNYWTAGNHVIQDKTGAEGMGLYIKRENAIKHGERAASRLARRAMRLSVEPAGVPGARGSAT